MIKRLTALLVTASLLFQIVFPTCSYAITSGPSQPEFDSFEPFVTNQMVDPFTGDFVYNLPLLVVPGPNGGYPVNLSYHAGIGMEQEASWVGLGWNINAGEVNHQLRGLSDDYKGDTLIKKMNIKPGVTVSYGNSVPFTSPEIWGLNFQLNVSQGTYYNNYKGLGLTYGLGLSAMQNNLASEGGWSTSLNLNYDSQTGFNVSNSLSLTSVGNSTYKEFSVGLGYNSREGMQSVNLGMEKGKKERPAASPASERTTEPTPAKQNLDFKVGLSNTSRGAGASFSKSSFVPSVSMPMKGVSYNGNIKLGGEITGLNGNVNITANYSIQSLKTHELEVPCYGYNYSEYRLSDGDLAAMDFNRENDVAINDNLPNLPIPVFTYDVYNVKGQGVGSVFRSFRSDVGILYDAAMTSDYAGGAYGGEVGATTGVKAGLNVGGSFSHSYSGKWKGNDQAIAALNFQGDTTLTPLYEPYYFKSTGEQTVSTIAANEAWKTAGDEPITIGLTMALADTAFYPKIENKVNNTSTSIGVAKRSVREKRIQSIEKKTNEQIVNAEGYANRPSHIFAYNQFPSSIVSGSKYVYATSYSKDHHLAEITVLNPTGERYSYSIPAYNTVQKDVMFAIDGDSINPYNHQQYTAYEEEDASIDNSAGEDHFFTSTELPAYAHSYLLTQVVSSDYIDLTGNGPTEDDFGYYVKFNYSKNDSLYRWRIPYFDANYIKGYDSNENDDKASYSYGKREQYYLNSIETKTHIAEFHLSNRNDGYGVYQEYSNESDHIYESTQAVKKLDEIKLYSKDNRTTPIKVVHFEYNYELCPNVKNNNGASVMVDSENINANKGKLTLKKVWFTYADNNKGQYSPYQFDYHAENQSENPAYNIMQMDRWGNYKPDTLSTNANADNPYVNQMNKAEQDTLMGAWNLKAITLPSGGIMNIEYESDDYAYVQNAPATQMMKIICTGNASDTSQVLNASNLRIYFEPERPLEDFVGSTAKQEEVHRYINGLEEIYFKAYLFLKRKISASNGLDSAYDYVRGYAELDTTAYGYTTISGTQIPYITVKAVNITDKNDNAGSTHPFKKAGWQYLKMQRPDLLYPSVAVDGPLDQVVNNVAAMVEDVGELLKGYYKHCNAKEFCSYIKLGELNEDGTDIPSFIRLKSPDQVKLGGGHRVKRITLNDAWDSMTNQDDFSYGQQYEYLMADSSSSGVAEYEPLVGGDENPLHKPIRYSSTKFLSKVQDNALFIEEPLGEAFYPSPNVGYRRILVKNIDHTGVTKSASGITEYKFYTAKEFPVEVKDSQLDDGSKYQFPIYIPFLGTGSFNIRGFSQGYAIYLNDMHGKMRSIATYAANAVMYGDQYELSEAVSENAQYYKTTEVFDESKVNQLSSTVTVMDADGVYRQAEMGVSRDFYTDERENESYAINASIDAQLEYQPAIIFFGMAFPTFDFSVSKFRSIVSTKIISQTGILSEVKETTEGSTVHSRNLMYDAETGVPLLTSITNEFNDPIYQYNYAAHWFYPGMQGAYKNIGAKFALTSTGILGQVNVTSASTYFTLGDELTETTGSSRKTYYVVGVSSSYIILHDEKGDPVTGLSSDVLQITRSGHRNIQSQFAGNIISLSDPVNGINVQAIFDGLNATINHESPIVVYDSTYDFNSYRLNYKYFDCSMEDSIDIALLNTTPEIIGDLPDSLTFYFWNDYNQLESPRCLASMTFPEKILDPQNYYYKFENNEIIAKHRVTGKILLCSWDNPEQCFSRCMDNVLHASATTFDHDWNYNYTDVGNPVFKDASGAVVANASDAPFRFGRKGIYRTKKNYVNLTERKQESPTDISKDGTYEVFSPYDWTNGASNPTWTMSNQITQYSPYGYETENKNALDIYSSALYGYDNSVVTAVAANASYSEFAFDGFEDYSSTSVSPGHGHFNFRTQTGSAPTRTLKDGHSGMSSVTSLSSGKLIDTLEVGSSANPAYAQLKPSTLYSISLWVKITEENTASGIKVYSNTTLLADEYAESDENTIDGWRKIDIQFKSPASGYMVIELVGRRPPGALPVTLYFDDIRLKPFNASMKTFVYEPARLLLLAEHDDKNYATFYNYDEEGTLIQLKKETERGIMTVQSTRFNTRKAQ